MSKFLFSLVVGALLISALTASAETKPNIVFIFVDDMGWGDVGCYGNDFIDTPNIDQLAKDGMRFTDFYAAGAVCSPTRCAMQSGQNQARIGITDFIPGHWRPYERVVTPQTTMALPLETVTVAESLKAAGYRTGYVGKWHLGRGDLFGPQKQGYDFAAEINGPHLPGKFRVSGRKDLQPEPDQFRTDFEADLCTTFISENKDQPFFLMLSPFAVHIPLGGKSEKVEKYKKRALETGREYPHPIYASLVEEVDGQVGRIVAELDRQGLTENTMVVFTSDNGGLNRRYDYREHADDLVSDLAPLKGEKGSLHEGGIRVPLIVKYPAGIKPETVCAEPTITYDFYPTFVEAAKGSLPENQVIDGRSLLPLFSDPASRLDRGALFWHYPHYHHDRPASAIRERDWKLIEYLDGSGDVEIYHIANDIGEENNLREEKKGRVADLKQKLNAWRISVNARKPVPNIHHNAERAPEWWSLIWGVPIKSDERTRFPPTEKDL